MIILGQCLRRRDDTRVVIIDRRGFDRLALEIMCEHAAHVTVSASVASVSEAVRPLEPGAVVLIGRGMLPIDAHAAVSRLRAAGAARVILVGTGDHARLDREAARIGADGALERDGDAASQARAVRGGSTS